ncbi:hypothetical protein ABT297_00410 [Dactylosporangium sp. NPDC000555]|uniref:hypothetical protein n=1 Tax=Dactylosporangium sp. NPDC000555 TaxID=3154260 RepID=UPI003334385B
MRRLLTVAILAALVSTSAACSQSDESPKPAASPTSSPSPTVDLKANTRAVCDKAEKIVTEDTVKPIGTQIGLMIAARQQKNKAAETQAVDKAKELTDALVKQARDLKAEAADPKLQTALDKAADGLALFGAADYLAKINSIDDMDKLLADIRAASADLDTTCAV